MKALAIVALIAATVFASAASAQTTSSADKASDQTVFCKQPYALCIKAHCVPIPTIDRLGNYTYDRVSCSCEIESGWSMGPGQCSERAPVTNGRFSYLISTYSNLFDRTNSTLTCNNEHIKWAWCYGAPCVADPRDVEAGKGTAVCTCPVQEGAMQTLGGDCAKTSCTSIWSAATPEGGKFASDHYAEYMEAHGYPHNPPAPMCPPVTTPPQ